MGFHTAFLNLRCLNPRRVERRHVTTVLAIEVASFSRRIRRLIMHARHFGEGYFRNQSPQEIFVRFPFDVSRLVRKTGIVVSKKSLTWNWQISHDLDHEKSLSHNPGSDVLKRNRKVFRLTDAFLLP